MSGVFPGEIKRSGKVHSNLETIIIITVYFSFHSCCFIRDDFLLGEEMYTMQLAFL